MRYAKLVLGAINLFACAAFSIISVQAQVVVTPNTAASTEGNSENGYPFNISNIGLTSQRYQQVYASNLFSAITGPKQITAIVFRPDATTGSAFSSVLSDIQINLSTTSATENSLSTTYANNVGANDSVVVGRGSLTLSSVFAGPAAGPKNFDIVIPLSTPFTYNPASGNLLLDVRNFGAGMTTQFDAVSTAGDGVARIFTNGGVTSVTGVKDTSGLVTEFTFSPAAIPESSTLVVLLLLMGLVAFRLRQKTQSGLALFTRVGFVTRLLEDRKK